MAGYKKSRYLYIWLSRQVMAVWLYRFERGMFLTFGKAWQFMRIIFLPVLNLLYAYGNSELHYYANIGPGIRILHTSLGNVVSGKSIIGKNLTLTGGCVIGSRDVKADIPIIIGDFCEMGAHAVILGPVTIGDHVRVAACACVVKDAPNNSVLAGVPAKIINVSSEVL